MNRLMRSLMALATGLCFLAASAQAQTTERASKDEAKALADAAIDHLSKVGMDKAFKDFSEDKDKWKPKDLYVFSVDLDGKMLAHGGNPKLVGKDMKSLKDPNGKMMTEEFIQVATTKGTGWVDYEWPHPQTKKIESKSTYIKRIPNFNGFVGVGVYR